MQALDCRPSRDQKFQTCVLESFFSHMFYSVLSKFLASRSLNNIDSTFVVSLFIFNVSLIAARYFLILAQYRFGKLSSVVLLL